MFLEDGKDDDIDRQEQMTLLRQLCVPYLTLLLHKVLTSNKQHREVNFLYSCLGLVVRKLSMSQVFLRFFASNFLCVPKW